jgi:signal transduction histidine kinase
LGGQQSKRFAAPDTGWLLMVADDAGGFVHRARAWSGTVRARTTAAAVLVVAFVLLLGAVALVASLRGVLIREAQAAAERQAAQAASQLESGAAADTVASRGGEEAFIQILDVDGRVVAATDIVVGQPAVAQLQPGETTRASTTFDDDGFVVAAASADTDTGELVVLAARNLDRVGESTGALTSLLAVGLPLVLLVLGIVTWRIVGRALAPVEAVRREVDEISAAQLHRRVPEPSRADEIARLAATMNRMLDRLEAAQEQQRRFVSDASHELRSPIAVIRQHAEVALAHPDRIVPNELATTVRAESLRLQLLVDDLLLLARADEGTLALVRRPLDLDDIVFDEAKRLRSTTDLHVNTAAVSGGRIDADPAAIRRVMRNITDNAARHASTTVTLRLAQTDGRVVLDVDDDGPGIAAGDRARVLDRFVRLDDARARDAGGAGLGLAIAAELVAAHDGKITIDASPSGGTRVRLGFPPAEDAAQPNTVTGRVRSDS